MMYQLFAPSRRHNRSDENETTSRNDRGQMIHGWLRGDHEHFPVRREKFRGWDYAYRYFILVVCRMTATIVPSIPMCAMS